MAKLHATLIVWQHLHLFVDSTTNDMVQVSAVQVDLWPLMRSAGSPARLQL